MTARLFARTSAANAGHTAEELFLPALRRHVEANLPPMPMVEYVDRDLSHRGPRPRLVALTADLVAGDVVVLINFAHAAKTLHHLAELLNAWLSRGARVVSLEDAIDSGRDIAGPYRSDTPFNVSENIARARSRAAEAVMAGFYPVVPHACTAHMEGLAPDQHFLDGALEAMLRCDEVWLVSGWEYSRGTRDEVAAALRRPMPVYRPPLHNRLDLEEFTRVLARIAPLHAIELRLHPDAHAAELAGHD